MSTPFTVTSPASAPDGFYTVSVNASDAAEASHVGSASATYVVMAALSPTVSTDHATYGRPGTVTVTTTVRANGSPVAGASVSVDVTKPNGAPMKKTATTDANGLAVVTLSLKRNDPTGTYQVLSTATVSGGLSGQATTTFSVQ